MKWMRKDLVGLDGLSAEELQMIFETADGFGEVSTRSVKKVPALRGKVIVNNLNDTSVTVTMTATRPEGEDPLTQTVTRQIELLA